MSMSSRLPLSTRAVATSILVGLVFWAPLPFASVRPGDRFPLVLGAATVLLLVAWSLRTESLRDVRWVLWPWVGWITWSLAQVVPLPLRWVEALNPALGSAHRRAAASLVVDAGPVPISVAPDQTLASAIWSASLLALFVAAFLCGRRTPSRRALGLGVLAAVSFQILYGARRWGTGDSLIWGVTVPGGSGRLRGTYVNPDHLALLLEIGVCLAGGVLWWAIRKGRDDRSLEIRITRIALPLLLWIGIFAALAFTGSRAGIAAGIAGVLAQGVLLGARRRRAHLALAGIVMVLLGVAAVSWLGLEAGWGRWLSTSRYELGANVRTAAYRATHELWLGAPWTGVGLGGFRTAFPTVQPEDAPGRWHHAHNDWLELLATTGIVGFALVLVGIVALALRLERVWRRGARSEGRAAALGGLGAMVAISLHELLDFGLTTPANALALVVVLGAAAGARLATSQRAQRPATASRYEDAKRSGA